MSASASPTARLAFLVYDSRSGSTLLAALLNRLAGVTVLPESRFVSGVLEYRGRLGDRRALETVLRHLEQESHFRELGVDRDALHARLERVASPWTRSALLDALIDTCFAPQDTHTRLRVIKSGRSIYHARTLLTLYPDARFVHVVRDGRAVFASKRRTVATSGETMETNILKAARDWSARLALADSLGRAALHVRYEDLLADPDTQIERVCDLFALPPAARQLVKVQADYARAIGATQKHLHTRVHTPPDPARAGAWRESLLPWEVALFQQVAGRWLVHHGYTLSDTGYGNRTTMLARRAWLWSALWGRRAARGARLALSPATLNRRLQEKRHERVA